VSVRLTLRDQSRWPSKKAGRPSCAGPSGPCISFPGHTKAKSGICAWALGPCGLMWPLLGQMTVCSSPKHCHAKGHSLIMWLLARQLTVSPGRYTDSLGSARRGLNPLAVVCHISSGLRMEPPRVPPRPPYQHLALPLPWHRSHYPQAYKPQLVGVALGSSAIEAFFLDFEALQSPLYWPTAN
jgi:hypothetical protein